MGWTGQHAENYRKGQIDRKAECDDIFHSFYNIKKSTMRGSTYYAALEATKEYVGTDDNGKSVYSEIPKENRKTFAVVVLTSVDNSDYFNFKYKEIDETMGPAESNCPLSILNLLSPTDNEYAVGWRERCRKNAAKMNSLGKLPVGTIIEYDWNGEKQRAVKRAPAYQFKTNWWEIIGTNYYMQKCKIPKDFAVVSVA